MSKTDLPILDGPGSPLEEAYRSHLIMSKAAILTIADVCLILKVSRQTVVRWIRTGRLQAFKPGGGRFWRIRRADFDEFVGGKHGHS